MHAELAARISPAALKRLGGSDLEYDTEKLEQLAEVVPDEHEAVVRAHLGLRLPWSDAMLGRTPRSSPATPPSEPVHTEPPRRQIERRKLTGLKPNKYNAALFPDSLSEASVALLAEDLVRHGQRVPGEITPDGTIVDCERRWRAAQQLEWDEMDVVVVDGLTDDDLLDRVLDSCTSSRQMSLREQVNVYKAMAERLKQDVGREQGRPEKTFQKGNVFLKPSGIRHAAAKRAGFSSPALALRAEAVFTRGTEDLQERVREGRLSISAAYDELPKRARVVGAPTEASDQAQPIESGDDESNAVHQGYDEQASPSSDNPTRGPTSDATSGNHRPDGDSKSKGSHVEVSQGEGENGAGDARDDDAQGEEEAEDEDAEFVSTHEAPPDTLEPLDDLEPNINDHIYAVCSHIASLAARDYGEAVVWFEQTVEELRSSLGEPPESEEEDNFDNDL